MHGTMPGDSQPQSTDTTAAPGADEATAGHTDSSTSDAGTTTTARFELPPPYSGLPPNAPRTGNAFSRALGRTVLRLGGWRIHGNFPDVKKLVLIAAPHSSGWDAVWGLAAKLAMGVDVCFMAKRELFRGPLGWLLRALGGMPIERSTTNGVVPQTVDALNRSDKLWVVLAPEGTRRRVEKWKSGFWHIAVGAQVPVFAVWFHYPERVIGLGRLFDMSGRQVDDMAAIRAYYVPYQGKFRGTT